MEALAAPAPNVGVPKYAGRRMSKAEFLKWESDDAFVYEFNDGILEPTRALQPSQLHLASKLMRRFIETKEHQLGDELTVSVECWLSERLMRRPSFSHYTNAQINASATGQRFVPAFVIELISEADKNYKTTSKLREYFEAGVKVVWWVYSPFKTVEVYTSPKTVLIATDDDLINAAPALPDYQLKVSELVADATAA